MKGYNCTVVPGKLIKMSAELASLNHCAVPFLSRAVVNLCWYYYIKKIRKCENCLPRITLYSDLSLWFILCFILPIF